LIENPLWIGAHGGGFVISKGVTAKVEVKEAKASKIGIWINCKPAPEAKTSEAVVKKILSRAEGVYEVNVEHDVQVPIGAGYGASGAGALAVGLALNEALALRLTYNEVGRIAHIAEVECKTGLGTVAPLMLGGAVVTVKSGGPGLCLIDRIPLKPDYKIVSGCFGPIATKTVLASPRVRRRVNRFGRRALNQILEDSSIENFMASCKRFAAEVGLMSRRVRMLIDAMETAGAIGATQNMVGEAAHALVEEERVKKVAEAVRRLMSSENIYIAKIDLAGARLI
jgi:pantoate kinase